MGLNDQGVKHNQGSPSEECFLPADCFTSLLGQDWLYQCTQISLPSTLQTILVLPCMSYSGKV